MQNLNVSQATIVVCDLAGRILQGNPDCKAQEAANKAWDVLKCVRTIVEQEAKQAAINDDCRAGFERRNQERVKATGNPNTD